MTERFTPGPWLLCHHLKSMEHDKSCPCGYRGGIGSGEYMICEMGSTSIPGEEGLEPRRFDRATEIANAHLIAAAPDLYASLLELTTVVDNPPSEEEIDEMDKRAIKALAKARGEL